MNKATIIILLFCIILSGISYYIGYKRPPKFLSWFAKGSFFISTFILIPFLATILYFQGTATSRLEQEGIVPYPDITETVGIAFGKGEDPLWVFRTKEAVNIQNFYNYESNRPGWKLKKSEDNAQIYEKEGKKLNISFYNYDSGGTIIYKIGN